MAAIEPNSAEWGNDVAHRVFQIIVVGAVLFIGAVLVSLA